MTVVGAMLERGYPHNSPRRTHDPGEKIYRVVELILLLRTTGPGLTTREIAANMGVSEKTVQRYLVILRRTRLDIVERVDSHGSRWPTRRYRIRL